MSAEDFGVIDFFRGFGCFQHITEKVSLELVWMSLRIMRLQHKHAFLGFKWCSLVNHF